MDIHNFPINLLASTLTTYCRNKKIDLNRLDITAILLWIDDIYNSDVEFSQLEQILYNVTKYESEEEILEDYGAGSLEEVEDMGNDILPLGHGRYLVVGQ